jgi:SAM-dependent methyltransferase
MASPQRTPHSQHEHNLSAEAIAAFDFEFFRDFARYAAFLDEHLDPASIGAILDVGGGNGRFLDQLLERFPSASAVIVDNFQPMLDRNQPHPRKHAVCSSAYSLVAALGGRRFDLITINVLLHHLVGATAAETREQQRAVLASLPSLLKPGGRILVYEQCFEGWLPGVEPGALIWKVTRIRQPLLQRAIFRLGANTAGTGVAFRSRAAWRALFGESGLRIVDERTLHDDRLRILKVLAFTIRRVGTHAFLLAPSG